MRAPSGWKTHLGPEWRTIFSLALPRTGFAGVPS